MQIEKEIYKTISECRVCGSADLWSFLDLGDQTLPRFPRDPGERLPHAPLELAKCGRCHLVQLKHSVDRDLLFRQFWYRSGISSAISADLKAIAEQGMREAGIDYNDAVTDIGCNDGTLLGCFLPSVHRIGFEPAGNLARIAKRVSPWIVQDYFSAKAYHFKKSKLITAIAMFYDLENPVPFCRDVASCLDEDGVFLVQQNYLGLMLENGAYDNVCHEHLMYYSLSSLKPVLENAGLEIYRVEANQINGGSFKTFICHRGARRIDGSVGLMETAERENGLDDRNVYRDFSERIRTNAAHLRRFLLNVGGKRVMIYGAGTRGATIFNYAARNGCIVAAVDNNPEKRGLYYLDSKIPIISRDEAVKNPPDYFLVLPYHLADEIVSKERDAFPGTRWIIPLPEFRVV
jgi:hypothetical protein